MTVKHASTLRAVTYNGTHGNLSKAVGKAVFTADAANTVVHTLLLDAGTTLLGLKAHHDNLGVGTSIELGYAFQDADYGADTPAAFGTKATAAAGAHTWDGVPIRFEHPTVLTVTVKGGAGTGSVTLIPEYLYRGPM